MDNVAKIISLAVGLSLILAAPTFAGPPFLTDDPEPVDYQHWEFYVFGNGDHTSVGNYTRLYGSFAAGIATLVWLYITSFSVLLGAELNGVLYWERQNQIAPESSARQPEPLPR